MIYMSTHGSHTRSISIHNIILGFQWSCAVWWVKIFETMNVFWFSKSLFWAKAILMHFNTKAQRESPATTCQERAMRGGGRWVWMELFLRQRSGGVFFLFFLNGVGWGADMARISALMGVGVGLTFWDKLRFINAPVNIKPRSSDWRGGFCLCVPGVGSSQTHPHPLSHSPRAQSCRCAGSSATFTPEDLHV